MTSKLQTTLFAILFATTTTCIASATTSEFASPRLYPIAQQAEEVESEVCSYSFDQFDVQLEAMIYDRVSPLQYNRDSEFQLPHERIHSGGLEVVG